MAEIIYNRGDSGPVEAVLSDLTRRAEAAGYRMAGHRVEGISAYGCVEAVGTDRVGAMRRSAHAHTAAGYPHRGWLCFKGGLKHIVGTTGKATPTLRHEVAHVLVMDGHSRRWCAAVKVLGAPKEAARYERKSA